MRRQTASKTPGEEHRAASFRNMRQPSTTKTPPKLVNHSPHGSHSTLVGRTPPSAGNPLVAILRCTPFQSQVQRLDVEPSIPAGQNCYPLIGRADAPAAGNPLVAILPCTPFQSQVQRLNVEPSIPRRSKLLPFLQATNSWILKTMPAPSNPPFRKAALLGSLEQTIPIRTLPTTTSARLAANRSPLSASEPPRAAWKPSSNCSKHLPPIPAWLLCWCNISIRTIRAN